MAIAAIDPLVSITLIDSNGFTYYAYELRESWLDDEGAAILDLAARGGAVTDEDGYVVLMERVS